MGEDLVDKSKDNSKLIDSHEVIESTSEEVLDLKNGVEWPFRQAFSKLNFGYRTSKISEVWESFKNKLSEKFKDTTDSIEYALFSNSQFQALMDDILNIQSSNLEKEKNKLKEYVLKEKNRREAYNLIEVWDSDIQTFEDYEQECISSENFEKFVLSDEWIRFIIKNFKNHINPETGEVYQDFPIKKEALMYNLKSEWKNFIFRNYYSGAPDYERAKDYSNVICGTIEDRFNSLIWDYIKNWGDKFDTYLINDLEWLINKIEASFSYVWDEESETIKEDIERARRDLFEIFLKNKINIFSDFVYKNGKISLETWDTQIDLQLKSYLYIYGKLFCSWLLEKEDIQKWYESTLTDLLKIVLCKYNPELENQIKNQELLEMSKRAEQERKEREIRRRQEAERRNRERNSMMHTNTWKISPIQDQDSDKNKDDSGVNLVKQSNVNLSDFSSNKWENTDSISESMPIKHRAFRLARNDFIDSNDEIKSIITYSDMEKLYDIETNNINDDARKSFLKTEIMKWRTNEEIKQIYKILQSFSNYFNDAVKNITNNISERKWEIDEKVKIYALWSVIDNVKNTFDSIVSKWQWDSKFEWFSFDSHEPVKRQWNDIIISGKFNWAEIKIRYNLLSGWLFMNSFIQHLSPSKVTIWNNTDADYKIGQLESFDTILDEHYHSPNFSNSKTDSWNNSKREFVSQNYWLSEWWEWNQDDIAQWSDDLNIDSKKTKKPSIAVSSQTKPATEQVSHLMMSKNELISLKERFWNMLNANIDLIGDSVINHTKKQSTRNSVVIKFMKTFNIILDEENIKNIDVNNESNMFDFIQIIENSDSTALESFQIFMEKIMGYSWLSRWNNNLQWSQRNQKSDLVLHENDNNKYASLLRSCSIDFSNNIENLKWKLNFDSGSQLWFIDMICKNITNDTWKPNWKIDVSKMNEFIYHLENDPQTVV